MEPSKDEVFEKIHELGQQVNWDVVAEYGKPPAGTGHEGAVCDEP